MPGGGRVETFRFVLPTADHEGGISLKEIRLHGRGGQGTVKASQIIVYAAVEEGKHANSIPYFGFERSGAPVSAFVRLDDRHIWPKTQIYRPDCVVVMDATLRVAVPIFEGIKERAVLVVNCRADDVESIDAPPEVATIGFVDATGISLQELGRHVPNTTMLGAFARTTGWLGVEGLAARAAEVFGRANARAVRRGYAEVEVVHLGRGVENL